MSNVQQMVSEALATDTALDNHYDGWPCERCTGMATTTVKTRHFGVERLCAGCAANVRRDGQEVE